MLAADSRASFFSADRHEGFDHSAELSQCVFCFLGGRRKDKGFIIRGLSLLPAELGRKLESCAEEAVDWAAVTVRMSLGDACQTDDSGMHGAAECYRHFYGEAQVLIKQGREVCRIVIHVHVSYFVKLSPMSRGAKMKAKCVLLIGYL